MKPVDVEALRGQQWEVMPSEYDDTLYIMPKGVWVGRGGKETIAVIYPTTAGQRFSNALAALPELAGELAEHRAEVIALRAENEALKIELATAQTDAYDASIESRAELAAKDAAVAELVKAASAIRNHRSRFDLTIADVFAAEDRLLAALANFRGAK